MSGLPTLLPIVEGQSEEQGAQVLLRRLLAEMEASEVRIARPFRIKRTRVSRRGEVERAVIQGLRSRSDVCAILVLVDGDDDSPEALAQAILEDCRRATSLPVAAVIARRELEAWFLGAKESLRGARGIKPDANSPAEPESIRGAKERLTRNMLGDRSYVEVDDQPAFAAIFDLETARACCASFKFLCEELRRLVAEIAAIQPGSGVDLERLE